MTMEQLLNEQLSHLDLTGKVIKIEKNPRRGGGYGHVWRGRNDGGEVAIKVPTLYACDNDRPWELVADEACKEIRIWSRLRHDNILPLLGFCFDFSSTVSLISPWMANGTANEFLRNNPDFPSVKLLPGIVEGLCYLHENHIVHGDLRGSNILISKNATPLLADFGLSRDLMKTSSRNPSRIGGSTRWMAIEYLGENNNGQTMPGDVWALGMTILELATHKPPFYYLCNDPVVIRHITYAIHPNPPEIDQVSPGWDDSLWDLCKDCWHTDPAKRPIVQDVIPRVSRFGSPASVVQTPEQTMVALPDGNMNLWPMPAFCKELKDLSDKVHATENIYFAVGCYSTLWRGGWVDPVDGPPHRLAIKAFRVSHLSQRRRKFEQRLQEESVIWHKLDHPHVLRFLGVCYNKIDPVLDFPALISPLCLNGNIYDYILSHPQVDRLALVLQIASGLEYLHECHYVHGNLKGNNILIKDNGEACLGDFGCTVLLNDEFPGQFPRMVSVRWDAPELVLAGEVTRQTYSSDVWAFAMVILEVFTEQLPWGKMTDARITMALWQKETPQRPTQVSDPIWEYLLRCWSYEPEQRPSVSDFKQCIRG